MKKLLILIFSISLLWSLSGFADQLDTVFIVDMKDCKEELPIGKCECLFDSITSAELTEEEEELLWGDLTYDYREAKGIPETELSEDRINEIMEIMMNSRDACF